jgi:hypothetical protein
LSKFFPDVEVALGRFVHGVLRIGLRINGVRGDYELLLERRPFACCDNHVQHAISAIKFQTIYGNLGNL